MKTVIIYATRHGCTEKAARMLKSRTAGEVLLVNVMKERIPSLEEYSTVILGGSVYMGQIQKELKSYIGNNLSQLLQKKVGLFLCAGSPDPAARVKELESVFPAELYRHAAAKELFGYELIYEKLSFPEKLITKAMKGDKNDLLELDEAAIARMAKTIA